MKFEWEVVQYTINHNFIVKLELFIYKSEARTWQKKKRKIEFTLPRICISKLAKIITDYVLGLVIIRNVSLIFGDWKQINSKKKI